MADTILIAGIIGYGLIPIGLLWIITHYPPLRLPLLGIFIHMLIVAIKQALISVYPSLLMFDWMDIHRPTALLAGLCLLWVMRRNN